MLSRHRRMGNAGSGGLANGGEECPRGERSTCGSARRRPDSRRSPLSWDKPRIIGMARISRSSERRPTSALFGPVSCRSRELCRHHRQRRAARQSPSCEPAQPLARRFGPVMTPSTGVFSPCIRAGVVLSKTSPGASRHRTTAIAPMISSRLRSRCPILEICPSRALPPEEFCPWGEAEPGREVSASRAKVLGGGASSSSAVHAGQAEAAREMLMSRRAVSSFRARSRIRRSSAAICSSSVAMCRSSSVHSLVTMLGR